jgi:hypothetical protein
MNEQGVLVRLDQEAYSPGNELSGSFVWYAHEDSEATAVELSVLWYTEGKGDEDLGVHSFERLNVQQGEEHRFAVTLPGSPLSYEGVILKVRWSVRVRVFLVQGGELFGEAPFRLGNVATAIEAPA